MNVLIVLCGLPGSGKSTYAKYLTESGHFECVSTDQIRKELYGSESIQGDGEKVFNTAFFHLKSCGLIKKNCIFDATNMTPRARKRVIQECRNYYDLMICKYINTPLDVCLYRNSQRERVVPKEVILRMARRKFTMPSREEGFDYVETVIVNSLQL
jgi:predicted kinase